MGLRANVVETLVSTPMRLVNFTFAKRLISPVGYFYVASLVSNNTIPCEVDAKLVHTAMYDPKNNKLTASDGSYGERYFEEKSLLVHECTHALLDLFYSGRDMDGNKSTGITVLEDETIAYLAQAIYLVAANGAMPADDTLPDGQAIDVVYDKIKAAMKKGWTGCETIDFTTKEVSGLQNSIKVNSLYKSNYNTTSLHNG